MEFLEIENRKVNQPVNMSYTQFHDYYELYFLLEGDREVFIENKLFLLQSRSLCVIPPFSMHKTEGSAYERINLYISENLLSENESTFLRKLCEQTAFSLSSKQMRFITTLLKEASSVEIVDRGQRKNFLLSFTKAVLAYMQTQRLSPLDPVSTTRYHQRTDSIILQVVAFINQEYGQRLTLDYLHKKFFLSKNTLCKRFHEQMNCSLIEYVTYVRLNKAKMYLSTTTKNISEIAELCGFPSANYFGIIFKKQMGISPMNYRKKQ